MKRIFLLTFVLSAIALLFSCGDPETQADKPLPNSDDTPAAAYRRLFAAVKSKNIEAIKQEVSQKTQAVAADLAARQKVSIEKVYENGFVAANFAPSLPEIRDERVKDTMGAIEVWNSKDSRWEEIPYIREEMRWKLAVGDVFAGSHKSPGKGRETIEREAANVISSNSNMKELSPPANFNANFRSGNRKVRLPANQ